MASEVDICNVALTHLGDSATVASLDPPEGSAQAEHCARFYPIARDAMLSMHPWSFATRRHKLAQLVDAPPGWTYAYTLPTDALDIFAVLGPGEIDPGSTPYASTLQHPYTREVNDSGNQVLYCHVDNAVARYSVRVEDTTRFPPLFVTALSWHLAAMLAGPIIKGDAGMAEAKRCEQMMLMFLGQARSIDSNQHHKTMHHTPDWVAARGAVPNRWGR